MSKEHENKLLDKKIHMVFNLFQFTGHQKIKIKIRKSHFKEL